MEKIGKAYANRKTLEERPEGDLYHTPKSLTREFLKVFDLVNPWECASGEGSITEVLDELEIPYRASDLTTGTNFLECVEKHDGDVFTNPPFSLWDAFVTKAKELTEHRVIMLGRTNYFGTYGRYESNIWENLKHVYIFNRYADFQTPKRDDGLFNVGSLCTGWFVWEKGYEGKPMIDILDIQQYAKLGSFKKYPKKVKDG